MNAEMCRQIMNDEDLKCVVADDDGVIYKSGAKGIIPMLELLQLCREKELKPLYQADRIMGKAAVIIALHCGIREIYSDVVSHSAAAIAERNDIAISYDTLVEMILDPARRQEGPFEAALHDVDESDLDAVLTIIHRTLEKISQRNGG